MSRRPVFTGSRKKRRPPLLLVAALGSFAALAAPSAHAACIGGWDLTGEWQITHTNGQVVTLVVEQAGHAVTGKSAYATYSLYSYSGSGTPDARKNYSFYSYSGTGKPNEGRVAGSIDGDNVHLLVTWVADGTIREYAGMIDTNGALTGVTFNRKSPVVAASWRADQTATCKDTQSMLIPADATSH